MSRKAPSTLGLRAAIYVRVSTEEQGDRNLSIPFQTEACMRLAEDHSVEVAGVYADVASGKNDRRPEFQRLLKDAKARQFDQIIVYKYSRFGRNDAETGMHELQLEKTGVSLRSATEPFDAGTSAGWLGKRITQIFAEFENRQKAEFVRSGMRQRVMQGDWSWKAPFGYVNKQEHIDGRHVRRWIEHHPVIGPLVRQCFELMATGDWSLRELVDEMSRRGLRASMGGRLRQQHIQRVLHNPFYHGIVSSPTFDVTVAGKHEPLVSKELFQRVQSVMTLQGRSKRRVKHTHILRGLVWCACGQRMTLNLPKKGRYAYLRCLSHVDRTREGCHLPGPPLGKIVQELEECILPSLYVSAEDVERVRGEIARQAASESGNADEELRGLTQRITAEESRRERLLELRLDGELGREDFETKRRDLENRLAMLAARKAELDEVVYRLDANVDLVLKLANSLQTLWKKADEAERRELLETVVDKVIVGNGAIVNVVLRSPFRWLRPSAAGDLSA
jgi:DNA invertase Pin-like site-specific DNA recombinase